MHTLITGCTMSGKSTLAKMIAGRSYDNGRRVIVLDPAGSNDWPCHKQFSELKGFLKEFWKTQNCLCVIDESSTIATRKVQDGLIKTATQGRHEGHHCLYILQIPTRLPPDIRGQCSNVYAFRLASKYQKLLAEEFVDDAFIKDLPPFECVVKHGSQKAYTVKLKI